MDINVLNDDLLHCIFNNIKLNTIMKHYPVGDGEQTYTRFIIQKYPYHLVNKEWYQYFTNYKKSLPNKNEFYTTI